MKKIILLLAIGFGAYQFYERQLLDGAGAFDADGNPQTLVFTFDACGKPCNDAISLLNRRGVTYEHINLSEGEAQIARLDSHGGGQSMPVLIVGKQRVDQFHHARIISALAEAYGDEVLSQKEAQAMEGHFDDAGNPRLVMYGTKTCGFCTRADQYFRDKGVSYIDFDIDRNSQAKTKFNILQGAGTPLIYVGYHRVEGFNKNAIKRAIAIL